MDLNEHIEEIYRENRETFLTRIKRVTRNTLDAEDALHEAFANALARLDVLETVENLPAWIYTVMRNRVLDVWRSRKRHAAAGEVNVAEETYLEIIAATGLDAADQLVRSELSGVLSDAIAALPPEQRGVIEAQVIEGLTFKELAERSGESINTLTTRKKLAVKKLAIALRHWIADE